METTENDVLSMVREALLIDKPRRAHQPDVEDDSRCRVVYEGRPVQSAELAGGAA